MTQENENFDISVTDISKTYSLGLWKKKEAVRGVTFVVPRGEVVGLLGPNGSGKSTILKMALGFIRPTAGEILICGHTPSERLSRSFIGYLPENPRFQKFLTAWEVLHYYGSLVGLEKKTLSKRVEELLELVKLRGAAKERIQGYSKGMVQRLAVAQALLAQPRILIFDEPMSGLDPLGRMEIRSLISQVHDEMPDSTIFFSSHILSDVEQLCASVVLLSKGQLKRYCPIEELLVQETENYEVTVRNVDNSKLAEFVPEDKIRNSPLGLTLPIEGTNELLEVLSKLKDVDAKVIGVFSQRRSLEESLFGDESTNEIDRAPTEVSL